MLQDVNAGTSKWLGRDAVTLKQNWFFADKSIMGSLRAGSCKSKLNQTGQAEIQVVLVMALGVIMLTAAVISLVNQAKQNSAMAQKFTAIDFETTLNSALADGSVCYFVINSAGLNPLNFDATSVTPATPRYIPLPATTPLFASLTGGTLAGPPIAQIGQPISEVEKSLVIDSIQLAVTSCSGTTCQGGWLVDFDSTKLVSPLSPASVPVILTVDTSTSGQTTVTGCQGLAGGGGGAGPSTCPADMTLVGSPGLATSFCVHTSAQAAVPRLTAESNCVKINDSLAGRAHICSHNEWLQACNKAAGSLPGIGLIQEWTAEQAPGGSAWSGNVWTSGGSNCATWTPEPYGSSYAYRCCL
ncbi:MAG: hypothetical protein C5B49_12710 [Bdellovibrio sp.]|nr:MAG: hypothetical protein C5B49_12710 [Bdellovibrio sp.]